MGAKALKHLVSKAVATEVFKETGLGSSDACVALAAALSSAVLTGFLDGTRLTTSGLLTCRNAFVKVRAPGSREFTFEDLLSDLNRFRSFITTIIKLLACLGLHAGSLMTLVDLATAIQEALPRGRRFLRTTPTK
jgi:hypothetical protein